MTTEWEVERWGEIPYALAHQRQRQYVQDIAADERPETIVLCSHHPVVTLGKKSTSEDLTGWSGEVYNVERGGRATYHGPGQVICYPLINLKKRAQKVAQFLDALEQSIVSALAHYGVSAQGNQHRGDPERTGVWGPSGKKLASVGVAIKNWITYHGLALNLHHDPLAFRGINPCGYSAETMTSLEVLLQKKVPRREFEDRLLQALAPRLPQGDRRE